MPLTTGTCLGPYEIQSQLGARGMGEVYRANDTRLDYRTFGDKRTLFLRALDFYGEQMIGSVVGALNTEGRAIDNVYPRRYPEILSQDEIRASFSDGWRIEWIRLGKVKSKIPRCPPTPR